MHRRFFTHPDKNPYRETHGNPDTVPDGGEPSPPAHPPRLMRRQKGSGKRAVALRHHASAGAL
ncbi:hypothetical protein AA0616_1591 [Komagataeibacter nataicola NRIC 0616]|nr:hypothetical protein AA0616_1591 [Komagataeibacter nataicola NRIC 0616]